MDARESSGMSEEKETVSPKPVARPRVEGVDYTPEGIEHTRQALIEVRGEAMKQWPEAINFTVLISHVIALMADYKDMRAEEDAAIAGRAHSTDVPPVYRAVPEMVKQEIQDEWPTEGDTDQRGLISRTIQAEARRREAR
jgi:hypothetical protein